MIRYGLYETEIIAAKLHNNQLHNDRNQNYFCNEVVYTD